MLHDLDSSIVQLHDAWLAAAEKSRVAATIRGNHLERWALKVFVGMVVSGSIRLNGVTLKAQPPPAMLDVVFGLLNLPSPRGFYFVVHSEFDDGLKIKVERPPLGHKHAHVALGITIQFLAFRFTTWLAQVEPDPSTVLIHRPAGIDFGIVGRIAFDWIDGPVNPDIPIDIAVTTTMKQ